MEPVSRDFVILKHSAIILHSVKSPSLSLPDDIIFVGCDVIWRHVASRYITSLELESPLKRTLNLSNFFSEKKKAKYILMQRLTNNWIITLRTSMSTLTRKGS